MAPCFYLPYLFAGLCAITLAATVPGTIAQPRDAKLPYDSLNDNIVHAVGESSLHLNGRQSASFLQSNTSETFTPPATLRWTISIDAQIQAAAEGATPAPTCTLQICLASGVCGSKKAISAAWSTFSFVTRMNANEAQTATFITSCSEPARVIFRSIVTPDHVVSGTTTAVLGMPSTTQTSQTDNVPASTSTTDVLTTSSSASPSTSNLPSTSAQTSPLPQAPESTRIRAVNLCEYNRPILVSVPENPDQMLISESGVTYDLGLEPGNHTLSFTPLNSQDLCPTVSRTGLGPAVSSTACSGDVFTYAAMSGDMITLDCASGPGPGSDLSGAVDIKIQTSGSCPAIVRQVGCEASGQACRLEVYQVTVDSSFKYIRGLVRFRAIGEGWTRAYLQVTASNRATVSYVQERGSSVTFDQDLLIAGTIIQIECDIPLQPKIFPVSVHSACTRQPNIHAVSLTVAQLEPGTNASILVSSDVRYASFFWRGFLADHSVCVTNPRTAGKTCSNDYVATYDLGELAVGDTLELECPISTVYAKVVNSCPEQNPAIFGTTSAPESILLLSSNSFDFNVPAGDASATFTPLGGYRMCVLSALSTATACGTDSFTLSGIFDQDTVQLFCPDKPPPFPDTSSSIPLSVNTGPSCPNLLLQIGCEEGSYCQTVATVEGSQNIALSYPILSPAARLRVRILSPGSTNIKWIVSFSGGDPTIYDQVDPQWLEIAVPDAATQIDLRTSCGVRLYVNVLNYCSGTTIDARNLAGELTSIPYSSNLLVTTYQDISRLSFEAPGGRNLCTYSIRAGSYNCGASPLIVDGVTPYDQYYVDCG